MKRVESKNHKEALSAMIERHASEFSNAYQKFTGDTKEKLIGAAGTVKKEVGQGLVTYNKKAQKIADKLPGKLGSKAIKYPWVTISLVLLIGLFVGGVMKPARR
jgi:hypothetical protein